MKNKIKTFQILKSMRSGCASRAIGELNAMLHTYWGDGYENEFEIVSKKVDDFIEWLNGNVG